MTSGPAPELPFASGNATKVARIQSLAGPGWRVTGYDPGDAEERAEPGYRSAAVAKATAVGLRHGLPFALAHDCGYEFSCLDGAPGALTRRWLAAGDPARQVARLTPGSAVTVVHCLALWTPDGTTTVLRTDRRTVVGDPLGALCSDGLPLTDLAAGEQTALRRCLHDLLPLAADRVTDLLQEAVA